ncbi:MAG: glutathione S-transferase [Alphaproteobacteria bacterium]|nr:glutathione S-transferase [Alphaproteobacteria bacterium]
MTEHRLYIGTRRYSSWSLRGWLAVRLARLDVAEIVIPLAGGVTPGVRAASPGGTVPYLEHAGNKVWDSLAICEYCAEQAPSLWPDSPAARAHARVISAEMHSGFRELRMAMPMSLFRPGSAGSCASDAVMEDIARVSAIWRETRARFGAGGPFLFGRAFTLADAMYAPVVARLLTYAPPLDADAAAYCAAVRAHPLVDAWYSDAAAEPAAWFIEKYETAP